MVAPKEPEREENPWKPCEYFNQLNMALTQVILYSILHKFLGSEKPCIEYR